MPTKNICQRCNGSGVEPDQETTGNEMRKAREKQGIDQKLVAERMKISQSYLSDLERGRRAWSSDTIASFNRALVAK